MLFHTKRRGKTQFKHISLHNNADESVLDLTDLP